MRRRLWKGAFGLLLAMITLAAGNAMLPRDQAITGRMLGHDFLAFYTAGTFIREGRARDVYNLEKVKEFQQTLIAEAKLDAGDGFGPFWNPPFYAWVFVPLSTLPFLQAVMVWTLINLGALAIAMLLLCDMLRDRGDGREYSWRTWMLVPLIVVVSCPFIKAISHGQNTMTSLLLLSAAVWLWRKRRGMAAGLVAGLLFYKPQLGAIVALLLAMDLGWRALAGLTITGAALALITLISMPEMIGDYQRMMPGNLHYMQIEKLYIWERHTTLRGFLRLLLQGREAGEPTLLLSVLTWGSMIALGGSLAWAAWRTRGKSSPQRTDRLIIAAVLCMPLLMPFYFDYDLLLLAVPLTLAAREMRAGIARGDFSTGDKRMVQLVVVLYFWLFANSWAGKMVHVNLAVPLLTVLGAIAIKRLADSAQASQTNDAASTIRRAA
jgi:alpha-1,2-mannosyltransferase